jgi:hypothetical protein
VRYPRILDSLEAERGLLRQMEGARTVRIDSPSGDGLEGGGLIIDYLPRSDQRTHRAVFEFNEPGLWPVWEGSLPS